MSVPLKAKIAIRDVWSKDDGPAQAAMFRVQEILGLPVICDPDWALLIAELDQAYPDRAILVSVVTSIVQVWFDVMAGLLDGDTSDDWIETLLEKFKNSPSGLRVFVETRRGNSPSTHWDDSRGGFIIYVPMEAIRDARDFTANFSEEILSTIGNPAASDVAKEDQPDSWAEVDGSTMNVVVNPPRSSGGPSAPTTNDLIVEYLPKPEIMARPDELLSRPPYHLRVQSLSTTSLEIQCSHSPTLEVLHSYLKKWCRTNINTSDKSPLLAIDLHHACFGLGVTYDRLTLSTERRWGGPISITPTMVLSLVEGQLGYRNVYSDAANWHFRRDLAFKR